MMGDQESCTQPTQPQDELMPPPAAPSIAPPPPVIWGRLISCHPDSKNIDLIDKEIYFGRNYKKCAVVMEDPTVSGIHCKMERKVDKVSSSSTTSSSSSSAACSAAGGGSIWITDYSTNGTFIKGNLLGKDRSTILQNGDMVSFTSSRINSTLSFIFQDLLLSDSDNDDGEIKKHYIIHGILGTGNFSVVKKCTKRDTGESFAVKIIDKKKYWHLSSSRNQTESEINILKQIKHPNIISIYEIFDTERYLYIVLELATGGELFDKIKSKGRFQEPEAKDVFKQILSAVSYLHQLNISHRDLKPENILYGVSPTTGESIIKITDFGLAKIIGEKEIATTLCGTPLYVAPEIIKFCLMNNNPADVAGEKKEKLGYGKEVDVWSLGCILYILLSGRPPFDVDKTHNFQQISKGIFNFDYQVWSTVTDQAKDLITRLLNVDPTKRITVKEALNHNWFSNELYRNSTTLNASPQKGVKALQHQVIHLPLIKSHNSAISLGFSPAKKERIVDESQDKITNTTNNNNNNNTTTTTTTTTSTTKPNSNTKTKDNQMNHNNINGNGNGKLKTKTKPPVTITLISDDEKEDVEDDGDGEGEGNVEEIEEDVKKRNIQQIQSSNTNHNRQQKKLKS